MLFVVPTLCGVCTASWASLHRLTTSTGVLAAPKPRATSDEDVDVRGYTAWTVKVLIINESAIVFAGRQWLCNGSLRTQRHVL